jgi:phage terminase Nu1 subunit (DNA packaging protein)
VLIDMDEPAVQSNVGDIVGVSQQAISALMAEGKIPEGLSTRETVHAYCHRLREQAAGRMGAEVGGLDLAQERAALAREMRHGHEIKNAVARGTYADIQLLAEVLAAASQAVVERFEQLPGMLKKACPELPDAAREQVMIAIAGARNEWVRTTEKLVAQKIIGTDDDDQADVESADAIEP